MKIIITESQIKDLKESLLLESNDDVLTYTTKYDQKLYKWDNTNKKTDYFTWQNIPAGTKFSYTKSKNGWAEIVAWKIFRFNCVDGMFDNINTGVMFSDKFLKNALKNKFCDGQLTKKNVRVAYENKNAQEEFSKIEDQTCIDKIKSPYRNALNWWKNKLNEPAFYSKLKKINNYTDQQTKDWIDKYKNYLSNNISGPFCPTKNSKWYKKNFEGRSVLAWLEGNVGASRVVFNALYQNYQSKDIEGAMVHEIQHALYDLKPMTPHESWKKVFPYKVWVSNPGSNSETSSSNKESSTISKYGIDVFDIAWWKKELKKETDEKNTTQDVGYICRETELASRVDGIKNLLNYSTSQKITVNDFKKFIKFREHPYNDPNAYWLVLCWINNGMEDIKTFLDNLDKYVVAKVEPKKGDDMKDQIT